MDVGHKPKKVLFGFAKHSLVPVLEKMPRSFMPDIERDSVAGHQSPHQLGKRMFAAQN